MSAYCRCGECKVRDMKTGLTPWCFGDVDRGDAGSIVSNLLDYVQRVGEANYSAREYVAYRREQMGLPADPREEWREHLIATRDAGALSPRQLATLAEILALI